MSQLNEKWTKVHILTLYEKWPKVHILTLHVKIKGKITKTTHFNAICHNWMKIAKSSHVDAVFHNGMKNGEK